MSTLEKILGGLLIGALIYIIFLEGCGNKHSCPKSEIIEVDTVLNETVIDTNFFDTIVYKYITVNVPKPYYDTVKIPMPINFNDLGETDFDFMMKYPAIYQDTIKNDTISIFYRAKVRGYLDDLTLGYKIFTPYYIEKTTTIQTEVTKKKRFQGFYLGMDIGIIKDSLSHVTPTLEASFRRFNYNVGFDLMDRDIIIGMRAKLGK